MAAYASAPGAVMFSKSESVNITVYNQGGKEADTADVRFINNIMKGFNSFYLVTV